jgi:APA family basic amino acid/polyamine antiporter
VVLLLQLALQGSSTATAITLSKFICIQFNTSNIYQGFIFGSLIPCCSPLVSSITQSNSRKSFQTFVAMVHLGYELFGFESLGAYGRNLLKTPKNLATRVFLPHSAEEQMSLKQESKGELKRVLGVWDLICLGVGMMLGAGVFVTTGYVAATMAGPAVILSYAVAGISALLSSLCYAEFAVRMPLVGGAYTYVNAVFGEYLAWITVANLILEYILANAASIRGFAPYFAMLINKDVGIFITPFAGYKLDWWAFAWCLFLTFLLTLGTKESSRFNIVMTVLHVLLVVFIIIAGFVKSSPSNAQPFFPFEIKGVFNGAALVFYSYIGFDSVACSAEEVRKPSRDLPLGILGALGTVTVCYMLMSATLVMMVPIADLDQGAPFAAAFAYNNLQWARYIVALGALMGIITTTLVGMYATARIIAASARQHMLPPFLARVHPRLGTPYISQILSGIAAAIIALFTDFSDLVDMVSISTLFAFWMVALALIWHRYFRAGATTRKETTILSVLMAVLVGAAIAFTVVYQLLPNDFIGMVVCAAVGIAATICMQVFLKQYNLPGGYGVPLFPYVPALSVGVNAFLLGQLKQAAYERFGIWTAVVTLVYVIYSMPASAYREKKMNSLPDVKVTDGLPPFDSGNMLDAGVVAKA